MSIETSINLDYLLPVLRMQLGDTDSASYRYMDSWLRTTLVTGVKAMQRWWGSRYIVDDTTKNVSRNTEAYTFTTAEPPVIQDADERPLILMCSILVKSGQLEANSWNVGSWKDAEIAVSTIEGSRAKEFGYKMDWEELQMYVLPPTKRLATPLRIAHPSTEE
jgi:hypothetical protein